MHMPMHTRSNMLVVTHAHTQPPCSSPSVQALLGGACGTWAERVALLYVTLAKAVHLEAVQLSGFWRDSAAMAVAPGDTLVTHNHSWAAVKVNGRWRLLDPVYASLRCVVCVRVAADTCGAGG